MVFLAAGLLVLKPIFELENQPNQQQQRLLIWAHLMCFYCCLLLLFSEHGKGIYSDIQYIYLFVYIVITDVYSFLLWY